MGVSIKYSMPFDRLIEESVEDIRNQVQKRTFMQKSVHAPCTFRELV